ncbi:ATP-dependent metalloprotease, partial [Francisella tularensis subsp. holarctica]|nr:ATP-dependent metalloprotease [Francisella tularensis subsp. holarctica]
TTIITKIKAHHMTVIDVDGRTITGKTNAVESFVTYAPLLDGSLVNKLEDSNAIDKAKAPEKPNIFLAFLLKWLPMIL